MVEKGGVLVSEKNKSYLKNQRLAEDFKKKDIVNGLWVCQTKEDRVLS